MLIKKWHHNAKNIIADLFNFKAFLVLKFFIYYLLYFWRSGFGFLLFSVKNGSGLESTR